MARDQFHLGEKWRGDDWYDKFVVRHRVELHIRHPKALAAKRAAKEALVSTEQFADRLAAFHERHTFSAETISHCDESLLHATITSSGEGRVEYVKKTTSNVLQPRGIRCGSVLPS